MGAGNSLIEDNFIYNNNKALSHLIELLPSQLIELLIFGERQLGYDINFPSDFQYGEEHASVNIEINCLVLYGASVFFFF